MIDISQFTSTQAVQFDPVFYVLIGLTCGTVILCSYVPALYAMIVNIWARIIRAYRNFMRPKWQKDLMKNKLFNMVENNLQRYKKNDEMLDYGEPNLWTRRNYWPSIDPNDIDFSSVDCARS